MTHMKPMAESEGTFSEYIVSQKQCPECSLHTVRYRVWESSDGAYEDEKYECENCGHIWWVEGPDA